MSILRRLKWLVAAAVTVGVIGGVAVAHSRPPQYSSTSQVLLAPSPVQSNSQTTALDSATQVSIALSDVVLGPAGQAVTPKLSTRQVADLVDVTALTGNVLEVDARGPTAAQAEALAHAMAVAEVDYQNTVSSSLSAAQMGTLKQQRADLQNQSDTVGKELAATKNRLQSESATSPLGRQDASTFAQLTSQQADLVLQIAALQNQMLSAQTGIATIIQSSSPAQRPLVWLHDVLWALAGAALSLIVVSTLALLLARRDRRLRTRDEIADATGTTVLASIRSHVPKDAAGWATLLETYQPDAVEAWAIRQVLENLDLRDLLTVGGTTSGKEGRQTERRTITVVCLSDDQRGLAVAVQLASHVASLGLDTVLRALQECHESANALQAAIASYTGRTYVRPDLRVESRRPFARNARLLVRLIVIDRLEPELPDLSDQQPTVLCLAAGSATAEELARTAVAVFGAGGRISGVIVADPDAFDRTNGHLLAPERARQAPLPTHLTGLESGQAGSGLAGRRRS